MRWIYVIAMLAVANVVNAQVTLPKEIKGKPGSFIQVPATTQQEQVEWYLVDSGAELFPPYLLKTSKVAVLISNRQGRYRLLAFTCNGGTLYKAETVVVIGEPEPIPPTPDQLTAWEKGAKGALAKDSGKEKLGKLIELFDQFGRKTVFDKSLQTGADLFRTIHTARQNLIADTELSNLRDYIGTRLNESLKINANELLTDEYRTQAGREYTAIAASLRKIQ